MTEKSPLQNLRELFECHHLSGVIVPHGDEFQNEFLPPSSQRLHFLTGFDGSAGLALALIDDAALFIDGRYTLAAKDQVDEREFSIYPWTFENIQNFLKSNLIPNMQIGFDPWTITERDISSFNSICDPLGIFLKPLSFNPIDTIWTSRPSLPSSQAFLHENSYAGETSISKRHRLCLELQKESADALYISLPESLNWLLNIRGEDVPYTPLSLCTGILHKDTSLDVFIDLNKLSPSVQQSLGQKVRFYEPTYLGERLRSLKGIIWIDDTKAPLAVLTLLRTSDKKLLIKQDPCLLAKALKNPTESEGMRIAHKKDAKALIQFLKTLDDQILQNVSLTESDAAQTLDLLRQKNSNYISPSFETISAAGSNAAIVHYHPNKISANLLEKNTLYLVDSGGQYFEGTTDVTRTIFLGKEPAQCTLKEAFTWVLKGHIALATIKFPHGTTGHQLDVLARQFLWKQGLEYDHGTGHGVGSFLAVHEGPQSISKRSSSTPLLPGMILSNEPGFYKPNEFGIRIESLVLVIPWKETDRPFYAFETLTLVPFDRKLILTELLTQEEKLWVNQYHKHIFDELQKDLEPEMRAWLKGATQPLT